MPASETSGVFTAGQFLAARILAFIPGSPNIFGQVRLLDLLDGVAGAIPEEVTGTTYTFVADDVGKVKDLSNAAGCAVTVPAGVFEDYDMLVATTRNAGSTLVAGAGVTLRVPGVGGAPYIFQEANATINLKNMGGDDWLVIGGIEGTI